MLHTHEREFNSSKILDENKISLIYAISLITYYAIAVLIKKNERYITGYIIKEF